MVLSVQSYEISFSTTESHKQFEIAIPPFLHLSNKPNIPCQHILSWWLVEMVANRRWATYSGAQDFKAIFMQEIIKAD